ncbi:hypothetical protein EHO59_00210 [Leptospira semungkisensis]|uniref:Lipoprotein n=1 Tax=Leptospira semungkisensis TaxID=2484985 RepID=A0A4R9G5E7_9LEPT|nr:hypothetical protein [Leptospira semungkisensis]TGK06601.1 hypothetical protein EHO59_00210 [Leptospira semungkisensis]
MNIFRKKLTLLALFAVVAISCSTTQRVSVLSFGNLEGKQIPDSTEKLTGGSVEGENCGFAYSLALAVHQALQKLPQADTLLNADVTHKTGIFVVSNCISVKGFATNSANLKEEKKK